MADLADPALKQTDSGFGIYPALSAPRGLMFPTAAALRSARRFARQRRGSVAFAVADHHGWVSGVALHRHYRSASLDKAMLLVAYLRRSARQRRPVAGPALRRLDAMIRTSDNDAASAVYRAVGDAELRALARAAGMTGFRVNGSWSEATLTAADQTRFFLALDDLTPRRHRPLERRLLATVVGEQSWGIPRAARPRWHTYFKGGWRPHGGGELIHQGAYLERGRRRVAIVVLTDRDPAAGYGQQTVEGIARRLLAGGDGPVVKAGGKK